MRERKSEGRGDVEVSGETKGKMVILFIILTPLALVNGRGGIFGLFSKARECSVIVRSSGEVPAIC